MIKADLCDYSDGHILASGIITITGGGAEDAATWADEINEGVIFKICAPFTDCVSEINNTQIEKAKDIDAVMQMYNLIEYSDNYPTTSGSSRQYYRDEPTNTIQHSESFKSKIKITGNTSDDCNTKDVEMAVPLK